jgi:hypothetical protein
MTKEYKEGYRDGFRDGFEAAKGNQPKPVDIDPDPILTDRCSICGRIAIGIANYICHRFDCPNKMYWK